MKLRTQIPRKIAEPIPVKVELTLPAGQIIAERKTTLIMGLRPLAPPQLASQAQKSASKARQRAWDVIAATSTLAVSDTKPKTDETQTAATSSSEPIRAPAEETPAQRLLKRGCSFLLDGDISISRQFHQRSAKLGLATGAIAMALTYDPIELPKRVCRLFRQCKTSARLIRESKEDGLTGRGRTTKTFVVESITITVTTNPSDSIALFGC